MEIKRVSYKYVLEKVYRDLGVNKELPEDDVTEWCGEALLKIGAYNQFIPKTTMLEINNCKASLPCDLYKLKQVSYNGIPIQWANNSLVQNHFCSECELPLFMTQVTFYINNAYIFLNFNDSGNTKFAKICIDYIAIPTDEAGLPTIPDDVSYMEACKAYVTMKMDYIDWRKGVLPDKVYQHSEREWNWYVGQARASGNMPDISQLENIKNTLQRLLPLNDEFNRGFRNLGKQESKYIQK